MRATCMKGWGRAFLYVIMRRERRKRTDRVCFYSICFKVHLQEFPAYLFSPINLTCVANASSSCADWAGGLASPPAQEAGGPPGGLLSCLDAAGGAARREGRAQSHKQQLPRGAVRGLPRACSGSSTTRGRGTAVRIQAALAHGTRSTVTARSEK